MAVSRSRRARAARKRFDERRFLERYVEIRAALAAAAR